LARRVRTDQRWGAGIGAGGGQPGSIAWEGRSLLVDQHVDVEVTKGGQNDTNNMRIFATGGAARSGGGVIRRIDRRRKARNRRFE
jgi:hypothetical protein